MIIEVMAMFAIVGLGANATRDQSDVLLGVFVASLILIFLTAFWTTRYKRGTRVFISDVQRSKDRGLVGQCGSIVKYDGTNPVVKTDDGKQVTVRKVVRL